MAQCPTTANPNPHGLQQQLEFAMVRAEAARGEMVSLTARLQAAEADAAAAWSEARRARESEISTKKALDAAKREVTALSDALSKYQWYGHPEPTCSELPAGGGCAAVAVSFNAFGGGCGSGSGSGLGAGTGVALPPSSESFRDEMEELRYYKMLLDSVGASIMSVDENMCVRYWGPVAEEMVGLTSEEVRMCCTI